MIKKCWAPADKQNSGFMAKNHHHSTSNAAHQNRVKNANAMASCGDLLTVNNDWNCGSDKTTIMIIADRTLHATPPKQLAKPGEKYKTLAL